MSAHWLDKYIIEQAYHYGVSVAKFKELMSEAAEYQELIETETVKEPPKKENENADFK